MCQDSRDVWIWYEYSLYTIKWRGKLPSQLNILFICQGTGIKKRLNKATLKQSIALKIIQDQFVRIFKYISGIKPGYNKGITTFKQKLRNTLTQRKVIFGEMFMVFKQCKNKGNLRN